MPSVVLQYESTRKGLTGYNTTENRQNIKRMSFRAWLDDKDVPFWASPVAHDDLGGVHSITVNRAEKLQVENAWICLKNSVLIFTKQ